MRVSFEHRRHPHIEARKQTGPARRADEKLGLNGRIAIVLTTAVGTMWCAYAFAVLALLVLPDAIRGGLLTLIQWLSQTFIQLVMLSVIMVGQNILGRASDRRAEMTYKDAEATFHEAQQIQAHLKAQDEAMNAILERMERMEAALAAIAPVQSPPGPQASE
jgi:DNA integrity scanning protein DisA with diadenylate cyclase activity